MVKIKVDEVIFVTRIRSKGQLDSCLQKLGTVCHWKWLHLRLYKCSNLTSRLTFSPLLSHLVDYCKVIEVHLSVCKYECMHV